MFIHRPEYYEKNEEEIEKNNWKNLAQIIIGKHRNGATGTINLTFIPEFGRFDNRETLINDPRTINQNQHPTQYLQNTQTTQPNKEDVEF
ncbi:hypothetical protein SDC9_183929 [bioreactor metagenome]|uniref:SF4 helicase domain-containing protein n=1 Tax=bioreactor metagenome TaxID=1076179 RepID=A0A645HCG4_9ZZZZ